MKFHSQKSFHETVTQSKCDKKKIIEIRETQLKMTTATSRRRNTIFLYSILLRTFIYLLLSPLCCVCLCVVDEKSNNKTNEPF